MRDDQPYIPWTEGRKLPVASWREQFLGQWEPTADCVFSRERVIKWLERKEISEKEAEILMRLEYITIKGERKFIHY